MWLSTQAKIFLEKISENFSQSFSKNFPKLRRRTLWEWATEGPAKFLEKIFHFFPNFFQNGNYTVAHALDWSNRGSRTNRLEKFGKNAIYERRSYVGSVADPCLIYMFEKTLQHSLLPLELDKRLDAD